LGRLARLRRHGGSARCDLKDCLANPHQVPDLQRPSRVDPLVVDKSAVRRAQVLDRELSVGTAGNASMTAGDLGIAAKPSFLLRCLSADQKLAVHTQDGAALCALGYP
jgi:hypothetical protein